jgi:acyl-homoserine-lactone acylase
MTKSSIRVLSIFAAGAALASVPFSASAQPAGGDVARWNRQAQNVTITRDDWGIPHIVGKTDADAVFGLLYAQAEDDFNRVEMNYLVSLGRSAETLGDTAIYRDLRYRLINNPDSLKAKFDAAPAWLQSLLNAYADGLNYFLYKHPEVRPKVIRHFEPWMPLSFSDGSIGPDIETVSLRSLAEFYGDTSRMTASSDFRYPTDPGGSNGVAIAPSNTQNHHALLLINPHTSHYFRAEVQVTSGEGLNAYGAVTWGQIFVYQGFNARAGWMHSSSGVDNIDEYLETVTKSGDGYVYRYGNEQRPVAEDHVVIRYKTPSGMEQRAFTIYHTHHGPVERRLDGKWVAVRLMNDPVKAITQSWTRMKTTDYKSFLATMELQTNSSNNTTFADADGDIAYFHSDFIPRRNPSFDWTKPVDGSNPATEWQGLLSVDETPHLLNPRSGWLYNSNNWPWSAAGPYSPKRTDFPKYVEKSVEETPRGYHMLAVLPARRDYTLSSLIATAFDPWLPSFARLLPGLFRSYDALPKTDSLRPKLAEQIAALRSWDDRWGAESVPTSLAVFWGDDITRRDSGAARLAGLSTQTYIMERATPAERLLSLLAAKNRLISNFGTWQVPWGELNRFQRLTDSIAPSFDDTKPSIAVPFTAAIWGSLASYASKQYPNTKHWYGTSGNSFVAVVEFGDSVRARAVTAGGESGHPGTRHFNDEASRFVSGDLRDVYFYPNQLKAHTESVYHPGVATSKPILIHPVKKR